MNQIESGRRTKVIFRKRGFRARSTSRDDETDRARLLRLTKLIDEIASEIDSEHAGLGRRYQSEQRDAGFALETLENEASASSVEPRLDHITASMIYCEGRLTELSRQKGVLEEARSLLQRWRGKEPPPA